MAATAGAALAVCLAAGACAAPDEGERGNRGASDRNAVARELARIQIRPGLWEVSSSIVSASQDAVPREIVERMKGRRLAARHCITPEQAAHPDAGFLARRQGGDCDYRGFQMRGGHIAGEMVCRARDGAATRTRMTGRYDAERFAIQSDVETPGIGRGRTMTLVTEQSGRRVGECLAADARQDAS